MTSRRPPTVPDPVTARSAASRARLIQAARDELVERDGILEIDSVSTRAALSVGLIYRHFGSRAGLVVAVVDDFYSRYRSAALESNPVPDGTFAARERKRTELSVAFHYRDPLAPVILSNLHLDAQVAVVEAAHVDELIRLTARVMALGQRRGELPKARDARLMSAMIIGGMRHVLAVALTSQPRISEKRTAGNLWTLVAGILGVDN